MADWPLATAHFYCQEGYICIVKLLILYFVPLLQFVLCVVD